MANAAPSPNATKASGDEPSCIEKLDLAIKIRQAHHNSIWEEQKHFTWLISIILSAQAVVLVGTRLGATDRAVIISIASVIGITISVVGFRVQRIEGVYYQQANARFAEEYHAVYPNATIPFLGNQPNKSLLALMRTTLTGNEKAGVRDYFQLLFIVFIAAYTAMAVFSLVST